MPESEEPQLNKQFPSTNLKAIKDHEKLPELVALHGKYKAEADELTKNQLKKDGWTLFWEMTGQDAASSTKRPASSSSSNNGDSVSSSKKLRQTAAKAGDLAEDSKLLAAMELVVMKETESACRDLGMRDIPEAAEFVLKHNIDKHQFVDEELERKGGTLKGLWDLHHEAKRVWWERFSYLLQSRDRLIEKLKQDIGHKTRDGHHWEIECYRYSGQKQQLSQRVDEM